MSADMAEEPKPRWAPRFFTIWSAQAVNLLGSQVVQFSLVWWLTEKTGSATVLAMATMAAVTPVIFIGPLAGALVDRWNRRRVMMLADLVIALSTGGLAFLFSASLAEVWHIYIIVAIRATAEGFHWPAMQASTALMVPQRHLTRVAGLNQTLWGSMSIVAPPLGALLLGLVPVHVVLEINIGTALVAVAPLLFLTVPQPLRRVGRSEEKLTAVFEEFREGLQYVRAWQGLFIVLLAAMLMNLASSPTYTLMPLLVTRHFGGGVLELGWINSAFGVGMTAGGLTLSAWGGFRRRMHTSIMGLCAMGLGTVLVGLAPTSAFWLALAGMFVSGSMHPMAHGPFFAIIQAKVAPQMQGRVLSLTTSLAMAMIPVGMIIAGPMADAYGVRVWYFIGGAGCTLIGIGLYCTPSARLLEDRRESPTPADTVKAVADEMGP